MDKSEILNIKFTAKSSGVLDEKPYKNKRKKKFIAIQSDTIKLEEMLNQLNFFIVRDFKSCNGIMFADGHEIESCSWHFFPFLIFG
jgi:hypothetical protein